ncbi:alpha/beta hydrolase [Candidatus Odyssella thessalonicensis]|uniref:alpha/beta hydrolase n=1 Tax=Candidatus Odyssella thessalonicensis TaxID=84647 RepID=UPI000225AED4|nr:alpha/beta hydrolase fold domain-containing protein [Candidatus Odyssella thessalonicensis]
MVKYFIVLLFRLAKHIKDPLPWLKRLKKYSSYLDTLIRLPKGFTFTKTMLADTPVEVIQSQRREYNITVLYLHGGAFFLGINNIYRIFACFIARVWNARIILVDYPLLPQSPFPAAVNHCIAVYKETLETVEAGSLVVAGDSAGGNLTLSVLVAARQNSLPMPACSIIFSGWFDLGARAFISPQTCQEDPFIRIEHLAKVASAYVCEPSHSTSPLASPLKGDLEGLPPLFIQVGSKEILLEDSQSLAVKAAQQGVNVYFEISEEMYHVQPILFPFSSQSRVLISKISHFIKKQVS